MVNGVLQMNILHPKKLLNSKWTAVEPVHKAKHFMITDIEFDDDGNVLLCTIEAVINKKAIDIDWRELKDSNKWKHGWK